MSLNEWIDLPPLFEIEQIPVRKSDVWLDGYSKKWPHLRDIVIRRIGEVGLLLGADAIEALKPLEVRSAPISGGPYGIRTKLGWSVRGLMQHQQFDNEVCGIGVNEVGLHQVLGAGISRTKFDVDCRGNMNECMTKGVWEMSVL